MGFNPVRRGSSWEKREVSELHVHSVKSTEGTVRRGHMPAKRDPGTASDAHWSWPSSLQNGEKLGLSF